MAVYSDNYWLSSMAPARSLESVTPSDSEENRAKSLYVGTGGDLEVVCVDDDDPVVLKNVPDGTVVPVTVVKVMNSNTTAGDIVAIR